MSKIDEVKKFTILTDISNHKARYAGMTRHEIKAHFIKVFDADIATSTIRQWAKIYGFSYKPQRKPQKLNQTEEIKRTNQRIRIISVVIRNLCKQLEITHPSMLDKLIDGITDQYGIASCFENNTKELEDKVCESL